NGCAGNPGINSGDHRTLRSDGVFDEPANRGNGIAYGFGSYTGKYFPDGGGARNAACNSWVMPGIDGGIGFNQISFRQPISRQCERSIDVWVSGRASFPCSIGGMLRARAACDESRSHDGAAIPVRKWPARRTKTAWMLGVNNP